MSSTDSVHLMPIFQSIEDSSFFFPTTEHHLEEGQGHSMQGPGTQEEVFTPSSGLSTTSSGPVHINGNNTTSTGTHLHHRTTTSATSVSNMAAPEAEETPVAPPGGRVRNEEPFHCHVPRVGMNKLARNQLISVSILCVVFMTGEIIGGTIAGSLAIITDATHLATDLAGFLVSLFAIWIAGRPPTARMSFGYYRAEVIGALVSVLLIWVTTGVLVYLAVKRVIDQSFEIEADYMLVTSGAGVLFNIVMGITLNTKRCGCDAVAHAHGGHGHSHGGHGHSQGHSNRGQRQSNGGHGHSHGGQGHSNVGHGHSHGGLGHPNGGHGHSHNSKDNVENNNILNNSPSHVTHVDMGDCADGEMTSPAEEDYGRNEPKENVNINVRAAFIHVIGDFIQSIGVFIAAIIIKVKPEYKLADPICTFVFSVLVLFTTITILRDTLMVLVEAVPRGLDWRMCKFDLETLGGIRTVHSLNIWALTMDKNVVSVHLAVFPDVDRRALLKESVMILREKYHAFHTTVQIEDYDAELMTSCDDCIGPKLC